MKTVVITGSTRGIGFALARAFLKRDCQVFICSRNPVSVDTALAALAADFPQQRFAGCVCDVTDYQQVQQLWQQAKAHFNTIDIWINNAGISNTQADAWQIQVQELDAVVHTNILGTLYGTRVALQGFNQQGHGALYNLEGMGADGKTNRVKGLSVYGMTKASLHYFDRCLAGEIENPHILVGALQPGMVLTEMVTGQYQDRPEEWERVKGILSIIANPIEDTAAWLAHKVLTNHKNGAYFAYGGTWRILKRFIKAAFRKKSI
jgi:NAD(P)-dependent dehydrogenase (short-subunit alcohol dehydrogenase family)